ncbi:hypothetical protein F2P79_019231 [Pimephales promelas]|nr:hypothetical protein F2P79_019231 [Pimephales promelas]
MEHNYYLAIEPGSESHKRKRKRTGQPNDPRRIWDKNRNRTRINIGVAFTKWREVREKLRLERDADLACVLLDSYQKGGPATSTPCKRPGMPIQTLSTIASSSDSPSVRDQCFLEPGVEQLSLAGSDEQLLHESFSKMSFHDESTITVSEDANDLQKTVIEFKHQDDTSWEIDSEESNSDEDYVPSICLRTGEGTNDFRKINELKAIDLEETVHLAQEDEVITLPEDHVLKSTASNKVLCEEDIIGQRASIVYETQLKELVKLLQQPEVNCKACQASPPFEFHLTSRGTASIIQWAGDFMMATNVLLSGNNYYKVAHLFNYMNMGFVGKNTFFKIQDNYCLGAIKDMWEDNRCAAIERMKSKDGVVVLADGRMDSPGYCAQYCSYTAMENDSKEIISVVTIDKRQTNRNSVRMEKEAFVTTMDKLLSEVRITEICTDAHTQIASVMNPITGRYKDTGVLHSWDIWHGAKNLAKRITAEAQQSGQRILLHWVKDIVNHFWFCCKKADTVQQFVKLWSSVLHHVTNEHEWYLGHCLHGSLPEIQDKQWLESGSKAHKALEAIVLKKSWLRNVHRYLTFRSTCELESFHNHLLMYVSKRFSFSPPVYEARTLLAAVDYNHHKDRPPMLNKNGQKIYRKQFQKKTGRWTVYALKVPKDYSYIPDLQAEIVRTRLQADVGMPRRRVPRPEDPRRLGLLPSVPPPSIDSILEAHVSRGIGAKGASSTPPGSRDEQ